MYTRPHKLLRIIHYIMRVYMHKQPHVHVQVYTVLHLYPSPYFQADSESTCLHIHIELVQLAPLCSLRGLAKEGSSLKGIDAVVVQGNVTCCRSRSDIRMQRMVEYRQSHTVKKAICNCIHIHVYRAH